MGNHTIFNFQLTPLHLMKTDLKNIYIEPFSGDWIDKVYCVMIWIWTLIVVAEISVIIFVVIKLLTLIF